MEPRFLQVTIKRILCSFPLLPASRIFPLKRQMTFFSLIHWLCLSSCPLCFCNTRNHPLLSKSSLRSQSFTPVLPGFSCCVPFSGCHPSFEGTHKAWFPLPLPLTVPSSCSVPPPPAPTLSLNAFLLSVACEPSES